MVLRAFTAWKGATANVGSATVSEMNGCAFFLSSLKCLESFSSYHVNRADKPIKIFSSLLDLFIYMPT